MTTIVAIAGQKGGTGKSTIAVCLAAEWKARGKRVLLVDADPQGTSLTWGEVAAELNVAAPTVIAMGDNLRRDLPNAAEAYDVVVVDCPGRAGGKRTAGALLVADAVLLPCAPATPDIWALSGSIEAVQEAQALRPDLRGAIVLNRVDRTAMTKKTRDALSQAGLPVLKSSLGARVAFNKTLAVGQGITVYEGGSTAANELRRLVDEVEELLDLEVENVA